MLSLLTGRAGTENTVGSSTRVFSSMSNTSRLKRAHSVMQWLLFRFWQPLSSSLEMKENYTVVEVKNTMTQTSEWVVLRETTTETNLKFLSSPQFVIGTINNVNWTEWSAIWCEIICFKYDFTPKLHDMKFNYHFITAILKSHSSFSILIFVYPLNLIG